MKHIHTVVQLSPSICRTFSSSWTHTVYPFTHNAPFPPHSAPGHHLSTFCLWLWPLEVPPVRGVVQYSFLWVIALRLMFSSSIHIVARVRTSCKGWVILHCVYHVLFIHLSRDIWGVCAFGCCERCCCGQIPVLSLLSFLSGMCSDVDLWGQVVTLCLICWTATLFSTFDLDQQ